MIVEAYRTKIKKPAELPPLAVLFRV